MSEESTKQKFTSEDFKSHFYKSIEQLHAQYGRYQPSCHSPKKAWFDRHPVRFGDVGYKEYKEEYSKLHPFGYQDSGIQVWRLCSIARKMRGTRKTDFTHEIERIRGNLIGFNIIANLPVGKENDLLAREWLENCVDISFTQFATPYAKLQEMLTFFVRTVEESLYAMHDATTREHSDDPQVSDGFLTFEEHMYSVYSQEKGAFEALEVLYKKIKDRYENARFPRIDDSSLCKVLNDAERRTRPRKIARKRKYIDFMREPENAKLMEKYDRIRERIQERWDSLDDKHNEGHEDGDDEQEQDDETEDKVWEVGVEPGEECSAVV